MGSNVNNDQRNEVQYSSGHLRTMHGRALIPPRAFNDENKKNNEASDVKYDIMFKEFNRRLMYIEDHL